MNFVLIYFKAVRRRTTYKLHIHVLTLHIYEQHLRGDIGFSVKLQCYYVVILLINSVYEICAKLTEDYRIVDRTT